MPSGYPTINIGCYPVQQWGRREIAYPFLITKEIYMARFILDIETRYNGDEIVNNFKEFMEKVGDLSESMGSFASITLIEKHNTGQFHHRLHLNKLTKKQIRTFNDDPHG